MPAESLNNSQGKQLIILTEKVDSLTKVIQSLVEKFDSRDASLVVFQKDYYVEHQKLVSDVARHDQDLSEIKDDIKDIADCTDQLKTRTMPIDDIKKLKEIILGNGSVGLVGRIDRIERWMENQVWFQRLVIGAIVGQVIVIIVLLLKGI